MLPSSLYSSPTSFNFHRQFYFFIHIVHSAGQVLHTDAPSVVDLQFTGDGHHPVGVPDCLLCRSRIEQVVPGDGGLWEANSITGGYQMTFRNVVMDRCIETFQHTNETIHHHNEYLVITNNSSLAIINQSKAFWICTEPHGIGMQEEFTGSRPPPWFNTPSLILTLYTPNVSLNLKSQVLK